MTNNLPQRVLEKRTPRGLPVSSISTDSHLLSPALKLYEEASHKFLEDLKTQTPAISKVFLNAVIGSLGPVGPAIGFINDMADEILTRNIALLLEKTIDLAIYFNQKTVKLIDSTLKMLDKQLPTIINAMKQVRHAIETSVGKIDSRLGTIVSTVFDYCAKIMPTLKNLLQGSINKKVSGYLNQASKLATEGLTFLPKNANENTYSTPKKT